LSSIKFGKQKIIIRDAHEHNLKSIDLEIPHDSLTVVTGVSGSGKSSLAFDTLFKEGQRLFLESFSAYARQFIGKLGRPAVEFISGLSPSLSVDQKTAVRNPRSTVGSMTEIYDLLRLLFARLGHRDSNAGDIKLERRLFSFNSVYGACPACKGLGVEDELDLGLIIEDPGKTLREGALVITTKSGYIIYSQVTMEVLDRVCRAHDFRVDIPWKDLLEQDKQIILYGSKKIKIPFGKHPLKSRLRWSGITAKPREEGYYKGIIPIMEEILKHKRNKNILRFAKTIPCRECGGSRLRKEARAVKFKGKTIVDLSGFPLAELAAYFNGLRFSKTEAPVGEPIAAGIIKKTELLAKLGLGHLTLARESTTLSQGESQHIRLVNQAITGLRGVLYVLDEPSVGLHIRDNRRLIEMLKMLRNNGNTVVVVEHDEETIRNADWIIDLGPAAGKAGGEILFNGPVHKLIDPKTPASRLQKSRTRAFLTGKEKINIPASRRSGNGKILMITGASQHNLKNINIDFKLGMLNVVTGVTGAGKSTLVHNILARALKKHLQSGTEQPGQYRKMQGWEFIDKVIEIDQKPIGRTPWSNTATYTKMFDLIRSLFASLPESRRRKWSKGRFSFNVKGGRCEACQGGGIRQIGMHFLGTAEVICEQCHGKRFNRQTLEIKYKGKNIFNVLEMPIAEACGFFADKPRISRILKALDELGLGYIALGQPSTTLSGGEAQRVKLASELKRPATGKTLYILNEPTTGLHAADIKILLKALSSLVDKGNTAVVIEHDLDIIKTADFVIDLGPGSGAQGGRLVAAGTPEEVADTKGSYTGKALQAYLSKAYPRTSLSPKSRPETTAKPISFAGVSTHNLQHIDVQFPANWMTVITGVSGSGKSSLAFDTVFAESRDRFTASLSSYARTFIQKTQKAEFEECKNLTPAIAVSQNTPSSNPRSTVGTMTGIHDYFRLLFSRFGKQFCPDCKHLLESGKCSECGFTGEPELSARMFSFNHQSGACPTCKGLGTLTVCDPEKLVTHPDRSLLDGAMSGIKTGRFYGDPHGQHVHILKEVGIRLNIDFSVPWKKLNENARQIALYGVKDRTFKVEWKFKRKNRSGTHKFTTSWKGLANYVNQEYMRKHAGKKGQAMESLMKEKICPACEGERLNPQLRNVRFAGLSIAALSAKTVNESLAFFSEQTLVLIRDICKEISQRLCFLRDVGLDYLSLDRKAPTLSGGETRRVRLAAQLGSKLYGVTYVLDEPTIGLHSRDISRLVKILHRLRNYGNTLIVVEHDAEVIKQADRIIDLGPGAGESGGKIVSQGTLDKIKREGGSKTAKYLNDPNPIPVPARRRKLQPGINIEKAKIHNLKGIDLKIPSQGIIAVTGVSGCGKSTLVYDVIAASADSGYHAGCGNIWGFDRFKQVIRIDQKPVGSNPASNPATYTGIFDKVREMFAGTEIARARNYKKSRFSFNVKGGRCEACQGMGANKVSMDFLSDVWIPCEECQGKRYNEETLACTLNGYTIVDVLEMTVAKALEFFSGNKKIFWALFALEQVGLGYLRLGQPANTLSRGEAQRLKLASELLRHKKSRNLYLLDEPTIGLHFEDVDRLISIFHRLADEGHTLIIIEHHPDIIKNADWVIDLGPEGGDRGGRLIAAGTPEAIIKEKKSYTGQVLKEYL